MSTVAYTSVDVNMAAYCEGICCNIVIPHAYACTDGATLREGFLASAAGLLSRKFCTGFLVGGMNLVVRTGVLLIDSNGTTFTDVPVSPGQG